MIEVLIGCFVPFVLTTDTLPMYTECRDTKQQIEYVVDYYDTVSRYFEEDDILRALNIIYCESSGKAAAVGINTNGKRDVGLWQFKDKT